MELGQYRSHSGRSVDTAKSSSGPRTVRGRSIFRSCVLESGSRPEQVYTALGRVHDRNSFGTRP